MARKTLEEKIDALTSIVEKGFAAVADDIAKLATKQELASVRREMATKDEVFAVHTQVNAIETQLRTMNHTKLHARVADLEEEVFGAARD